MRDGLSVYDINQDALRSLKPDIIVTQDQCEVCAASLDDVEAAVCDWVGQDVKIVSLHPDTLSDIEIDIKTVGAAIGRTQEAVNLVHTMSERMAALKPRYSEVDETEPSVLIIEWIDPLMAAGHWIPALVEIAGASI